MKNDLHDNSVDKSRDLDALQRRLTAAALLHVILSAIERSDTDAAEWNLTVQTELAADIARALMQVFNCRLLSSTAAHTPILDPDNPF